MNGVEDKESVYSAILSELRDVYNLKTIKEIKTKKHSVRIIRFDNMPLHFLSLFFVVQSNGQR